MPRPITLSLTLAAAVIVACVESPAGPGRTGDLVLANPPLSATVQFGLEFGDVGSPFPPSHDESFHAYVKIQPETVVIAAGGEVTFEMASIPPHSIGIYADGKTPGDIDSAQVDGGGLINDDAGDLLFSTGITTSTQTYQFDAPGRYLVICRVVGHFEHANMYGWVIVK